MRANVFTDRALASRAGQFVWLSIDTEKAVNAPLLAKFPVDVWPSLFVVDPRSETVLVRWAGSATVAQLETLLDTRPQTYAANGDRRARDLAAADVLYGSDKNAEAAKAYAAALATAPPGWSELPRVVDAYLFTLSQSDQYATCAEAARTYFPRLA